jgi:hypothetical protein
VVGLCLRCKSSREFGAGWMLMERRYEKSMELMDRLDPEGRYI